MITGCFNKYLLAGVLVFISLIDRAVMLTYFIESFCILNDLLIMNYDNE